MGLDKLPDLVLQNIFIHLNAEDIESLRMVNRRLFDHINDYRLYYSKTELYALITIPRENGQYNIKAVTIGNKKNKIMSGLMDYHVKSLNPNRIIMHDHDELVNMSPMWWKDRKNIFLNHVIDYRRYLPYFNKCQFITLECISPLNLTEVLQSMHTKSLVFLSLKSKGGIECTDEDLRKLSRVSNEMICLDISNVNKSSNISNDAILDMIEMGSFCNYASVSISHIPNFDNFEDCVRQPKWNGKYNACHTSILGRTDLFGYKSLNLNHSDGRSILIQTENNCESFSHVTAVNTSQA